MPPRQSVGAAFPYLSGSPWGGEVLVYRYAGRRQALCQLIVLIWLAPAVSRLHRGMLTQVIADGVGRLLKKGCVVDPAPGRAVRFPRTTIGGAISRRATWSGWQCSVSRETSTAARRPTCVCC